MPALAVLQRGTLFLGSIRSRSSVSGWCCRSGRIGSGSRCCSSIGSRSCGGRSCGICGRGCRSGCVGGRCCRRSFRSGRDGGSSGGRGGSLFLFATGGQGQRDESGNEERVFHFTNSYQKNDNDKNNVLLLLKRSNVGVVDRNCRNSEKHYPFARGDAFKVRASWRLWRFRPRSGSPGSAKGSFGIRPSRR